MSTAPAVAPLQTLLGRIGDNHALVLELIDIFDGESEHMVAELHRSIDENDSTGVYAAAHRLRGSLRIFAAERAVDLVAQLESMSREGILNDARSRLEKLVHELDRVRITLCSYRAHLSSLDRQLS